MDHTYWKTGELARLTGVSVRTLRFYDQAGLLAPSARSEAGYRLYQEADLTRLQQILALKFLGLALGEIRAVLGAPSVELHEVLEQQRCMLRERRQQLDAVLAAIDQAHEALRSNGERLESVVHVIRAIQMSQNNDWQSKYLTEEQRAAMEQLRTVSYSPEAKAALAARPAWTEEDQKQVEARYAALWDGVKQAYAAGEDPAGARAQGLAAQAIGLIEEFTQGNPAVTEGLQKFWSVMGELPKEQRPFQTPLSDEETTFLERAKEVFQQARG